MNNTIIISLVIAISVFLWNGSDIVDSIESINPNFKSHWDQMLDQIAANSWNSEWIPFLNVGSKILVALWLFPKLYFLFFEPIILSRYDECIRWNEEGRFQQNSSPLNSKQLMRRGKIPHPYPTGWFKITDSFKLKRGDFQIHQILGKRVALFRDEMSGKACIRATSIKNMEPTQNNSGGQEGLLESSSSSSLSLPWPVEERNGGIFIYYDADLDLDTESELDKESEIRKEMKDKNARDMDEDEEECIPSEVEPKWNLPQFAADKDLVFLGKFEHVIEAHIQEIPENGADVAHLNVLHQPFYIDVFPLNKILYQQWNATWTPSSSSGHSPSSSDDESENEGTSVGANELYGDHVSTICLTQKLLCMGYEVPLTTVNTHIKQIGPSLVRLQLSIPFGTYTVWQSVTPVSPLRQKVSHVIWGRKGAFYTMVSKIVLSGFYSQFVRDIAMWNNKMYISKPIIVKNDGPIMQFRRWYARFYPKREWKQMEE